MIAPRWYQAEAIDAFFQYWEEHNGNPLFAMPTGTGKSLVIGGTIYSVIKRYPQTRQMMLTHVKELVEQNTNAIRKIDPDVPVGVYSAGLKKREFTDPITYGNVQSVANVIDKFGHIDLLYVDEAHMISPKGTTRYQKVIDTLRSINPKLKVCGYTATHFRLGQGLLTDPGGIFTDIAYDLTGVDAFNRLISEGYLAPLIPRPTATTFDLREVKISGGEYVMNQLQAAVDKHDITYAAVREMIELGQDRRAWLVFATGIEHANHVCDMLNAHGIEAAAVHSEMGDEKRDEVLKAYTRGELRAVVNNNVLTTGFDYAPIDLIGVLRPTMSAALWVQMLGRGTRPADGKSNCLVLDFARNTAKLGPINDPVIPSRPGLKKRSVAPVKTCEHCGTYNHTRATHCVACGAEFSFAVGFQAQAGTAPLIRADTGPQLERFEVTRVLYTKHTPKGEGRIPLLRVNYICGFNMYTKFVPLQHPPPACGLARKWWKERTSLPPPETIDEALRHIEHLEKPVAIVVNVAQKYPDVVSEIFEKEWRNYAHAS